MAQVSQARSTSRYGQHSALGTGAVQTIRARGRGRRLSCAHRDHPGHRPGRCPAPVRDERLGKFLADRGLPSRLPAGHWPPAGGGGRDRRSLEGTMPVVRPGDPAGNAMCLILPQFSGQGWFVSAPSQARRGRLKAGALLSAGASRMTSSNC